MKINKITYSNIFDLLKKHKLYFLIEIILVCFCLCFELIQPILLKDIVNGISYSKDELFISNYIYAILFYALFLFLSKVILLGENYIDIILTRKLTQACRIKTLESVIYNSLNFFEKKKIGEIIERCSTDSGNIADFLAHKFKPCIRFVIIFCVAFISLWNMNELIAVFTILFVPFYFFTNWFLYKRVLQVWREQAQTFDLVTSLMQENIEKMSVIRVFGKQKYENSRFEDVLSSLKLVYKKSAFWCSINFQTNSFLPQLQKMVIVISSIYMVTLSDLKLTPGELLVYISYSSLLLAAFGEVGGIFADFSRLKVSLNRVEEIANINSERVLEEDVVNPIVFPLNYDKVSLSYNHQAILNRISFSIESGFVVAIAGKVGSGKTSLMQLLIRMIDEENWRGDINFSIKSIRTYNRKNLRDRIIMVPQEPLLFRKTIRENLMLVDKDATEAKMKKVCKIVEALDFIERFPCDFDTMVGDYGRNLSGGQRQRLCIARALMKDFDILILDDSFSSIDNNTANKIWKNLLKEYQQKCIFVISNQIDIIQKADLILVIENGQIKNQGNHEKLLESSDFYKTLYYISKGEN